MFTWLLNVAIFGRILQLEGTVVGTQYCCPFIHFSKGPLPRCCRVKGALTGFVIYILFLRRKVLEIDYVVCCCYCLAPCTFAPPCIGKKVRHFDALTPTFQPGQEAPSFYSCQHNCHY